MKITKQVMVAAGIATIGLASLGGMSVAYAQNSPSDSTGIIDKIATRFNLNKDEVKAVFEEERAAHQLERKAEMSNLLQDAVDSGDLTADQKSAIEAKQSELQTKRESERQELDAWATTNGIDQKYLFGRGHMSENRLDNAVSKGEITAEQKTAIETKRDELESKRESDRQALETWAKENGIDMKYLMPGGGMGHGRMSRGE